MLLKARGGINDQSYVNTFQSMLTSVSAYDEYTCIFVDFLGTFFFSPSCDFPPPPPFFKEFFKNKEELQIQ